MGKSYRASLSDTTGLGVVLADWLRRLAADHDGVALIVAKTVGSLMIEEGPDLWFKLSRISYLTGLSPDLIAGILYRLRRRGRLHFERRDEGHDGVDSEYRFTVPTEMPEQIERARVWATSEVKKR
jgi:hypothetical protein